MRGFKLRHWLLVFVVFAPVGARLLFPDAPPMGWDSFDAFGDALSANESVALAVGDFMHRNLLQAGWDHVIIDAGWFAGPTVDPHGRLLPNPDYYPSCRNGSFRPLADRLHGLGLKFGLWIVPGIPRVAVERKLPILGTAYTADEIALPNVTCPWFSWLNVGVNLSHPGATAYYTSVAQLWAEWQVDYIKLDCAFGADTSAQHATEIAAISAGIGATPWPTYLSVSPGGDNTVPSDLAKLKGIVSSARVVDDLWDDWTLPSDVDWPSAVYPDHFLAAEAFAGSGGGTGPLVDLDFLPFGRIGHPGANCSAHGPGCPRLSRLTAGEQRSILTLWTICRSPLILGADLRDGTVPQALLAMVQNRWLTGVLADAVAPRVVMGNSSDASSLLVWTAQSRTKGDNSRYVAVFNLQDHELGPGMNVPFTVLGLAGNRNYSVYDLWEDTGLGVLASLPVPSLLPHSPAYYLCS
eukprot:TRINITY_DN25132_c0_g1_i1.p1 TRINITY_DN25132_c0_g1~~TRINITY_DN25132_c0_g1_i1.p1  ORF type:complete len:466 (+),score=41.48 TRINITY_DN25132_c0_g1_i1:27-1424(+)